VSPKNPYSREKLCPILGMYVEEDWRSACHRVVDLLTNEGLGHTLVIHTQNEDVIRQFSLEKPVNRILINTPAALGGIGATTNITPALTLGCGAIGGGSSSDNVGPMNLLNIRKVGYGVRSIDDLRQPAPVSAPAYSTSPIAPTGHGNQTSVSILDDDRFRQAQPVKAQSNSTADNRFANAVSHADVVEAVATHGDITEENVEQIIKAVLGRLNK
ncbi:MAG: acetaldehyde dehydrogenase, partial [Providencia alcalifaciens]|nr:acetaldehyde dehydrogenase [Providencia alcalifaciens]